MFREGVGFRGCGGCIGCVKHGFLSAPAVGNGGPRCHGELLVRRQILEDVLLNHFLRTQGFLLGICWLPLGQQVRHGACRRLRHIFFFQVLKDGKCHFGPSCIVPSLLVDGPASCPYGLLRAKGLPPSDKPPYCGTSFIGVPLRE